MFKKRSKPTASLRKRSATTSASATEEGAALHPNDDDEEDDDDDDEAHRQRLLKTKKKRTLLTNLQYKRGVDATQLLVATVKDDSQDASDADGEENVNKKDSGGAADTTVMMSNNIILERKHQQAMEEFIQRQSENSLEKSSNGNNNGPNPDENVDGETQSGGTALLTESKLYEELAAKARALAGTTTGSGSVGAEGSLAAASKLSDGVKPQQDADVGSGGAMLAAGTGIAEVILPPSTGATATAKAKATTTKSFVPKKNTSTRKSEATGAAALPRHWTSNAAVPSRFAVPPKENTGEMIPPAMASSVDTSSLQASSRDGTVEPATQSANDDIVHDEDDGRLGFEALRQRRRRTGLSSQPVHKDRSSSSSSSAAPGKGKQDRNRSSDDRVYKQFVARQRDKR